MGYIVDRLAMNRCIETDYIVRRPHRTLRRAFSVCRLLGGRPDAAGIRETDTHESPALPLSAQERRWHACTQLPHACIRNCWNATAGVLSVASFRHSMPASI